MPFEPPQKTLQLHHKPIDFYINHMRADNHFSMAGFSDAEFYCMMGIREGEKTGLGQTLNSEHGKKLIDVLQRRQLQDDFLIAIPQCLWSLPHFADGQIEEFFHTHGIMIHNAYERDQVTDDLARKGELYSFIHLLSKRRCCLIGPEPLLKSRAYIRFRHFVQISTPNLHLEDRGIERAVEQAMEHAPDNWMGHPIERECVYLVSAGVSAAVIIDQLHDIPDTYAIDCGSIWDAFVGVGAQREWRRKLYANPTEWEKWKRKNVQHPKRYKSRNRSR